MSNMITSGKYKIQNMLHSNRYMAMAGADNNFEVVGHDVANIIKVDVKNEVAHLVTLFDENKKKYIHIEHGKVVGRDHPQELQLSTEAHDGEKFVIHKKDINDVMVLNDDGNWTPIVVAPAPPPSVHDYKKKYWKFVKA